MTVLEFFGNALHLHLFSAVYNHSRISVSIFFLVFSRLVCAFLSFTYFHLPIISGTIKDCKRKACCKFSLIFIMCEFETSHFIICKAIFVSSFVQYVLLLKIFSQFFFSLSYEVVFLFCPFYWVVHNNNSYFLSLTFMSKVQLLNPKSFLTELKFKAYFSLFYNNIDYSYIVMDRPDYSIDIQLFSQPFNSIHRGLHLKICTQILQFPIYCFLRFIIMYSINMVKRA